MAPVQQRGIVAAHHNIRTEVYWIYRILGQKIDKIQPFIQSIISLGNMLTMKSQPPDLIISALYKTTHIFKESQNPFIFRSH